MVTDAKERPTRLVVVGDGYPKPGDACRIIGESAATSNYLDDSAALVGCLSPADAAKLNGRTVDMIDGLTLVSAPAGETMSPPAGASR